MEPINEFAAENQALLQNTEEVKQEEKVEKRNTKKSLITKIKALCEEHELVLTESDTQLNRSTKSALQKLLAQKAEEAVTKKLVGNRRAEMIQKTGEAREFLALQTMVYGLGTLNRAIDRGCNAVLPMYNYELKGFVEAFDDPRTQEEVRDILRTILRENPEIVSQISNPYIRLLFVYIGALSISIRKKSNTINNGIQPRGNEKVQAVRKHDTRSAPPRKVRPEQSSVSVSKK